MANTAKTLLVFVLGVGLGVGLSIGLPKVQKPSRSEAYCKAHYHNWANHAGAGEVYEIPLECER